jgi:phosphoserine phosphatase RsbU/P
MRIGSVSAIITHPEGEKMLAPEDTRVLVVEDNSLDRKLLNAHLETGGFKTRIAIDGLEAWLMLEREPDAFDVVLLDRSMPKLSGLELLARMKEHARLRLLPVILQTASTQPSEVVEGLRAGAYYYLTKPYDAEMLLAVVRTAASEYGEYRSLQEKLRKGLHSLTLLREARFSLQTVAQARDIAAMMATTCPDPPAVVIGLLELLLNAIEHGNLGITYQEKSELTTRGEWQAEINRRMTLPENATKQVELRFERTDTEIRFTIRDEGPGFEWQRFLDIEPQRAFDTHGRGIVMARGFSFDSLDYRGCGNEVVASVALAKPN